MDCHYVTEWVDITIINCNICSRQEIKDLIAVVNSLYQPRKQHKIVYSVYSMGVTAPKLLESRNKTMGQIAIHDFEIISHVMIHTIIISHQPFNVHQ